jgi:hypothetical protein
LVVYSNQGLLLDVPSVPLSDTVRWAGQATATHLQQQLLGVVAGLALC